jgi:NADPH-dependent 2,4-dienoyl-CoA reductase/sulfur reductase-like enzyme
MGRKLLADPELPNKLAADGLEAVRPCIYCYTCVGEIFLNRASRCAVNPASGREAEFEIVPAEASRRVLVVGGGPAGMEAARVAALRGHRVTLCEKSTQLGGTAFLSALVYPPNGRLVAYLAAQLRELPVEIRLSCEVTAAMVRELSPDVAVVAVGARRGKPELPGVDARHVLSGDDLRELLLGGGGEAARKKLTLAQRAVVGMGGLVGASQNLDLIREVTKRWMPLGKRVAILGGGLVGVELAEFLRERDREVTVIEEGADLAPEMAMPRRWRILYELREHGARLLTNTRVTSIGAKSVEVVGEKGESESIAADSVILAIGTQSNRELSESLESAGCEVRTIGDANGAGYIDGAMRDAARTAREI